MSNKLFIIISGVMGFSAVALGAFGAHGLKNILTEQLLETYKTGILYHLIHSVALLTIAIAGKINFIKSFWLFFTGIILFSFSLYIYSITQVLFFAMITPFGGIFLLLGWLFLIIEGIKKDKA